MMLQGPSWNLERRLRDYCEGYFYDKPVADDDIDVLVRLAMAHVKATLEELQEENNEGRKDKSKLLYP